MSLVLDREFTKVRNLLKQVLEKSLAAESIEERTILEKTSKELQLAIKEMEAKLSELPGAKRDQDQQLLELKNLLEAQKKADSILQEVPKIYSKVVAFE